MKYPEITQKIEKLKAAKIGCTFFEIHRESLVGTEERHLKLNNFGFRKAFLIILFVTFRAFFVAPGVTFLKFLF